MRALSILRPAVVALLFGPPSASAAPTADFVVHLANLSTGRLEIEASYAGQTGAVRICDDRDGDGKYVRDPRLASGAALRVDPEDPDCLLGAIAEPGGVLKLRYSFDLAGLAEQSGDPDDASRNGDDWVFNDGAILLRPDPLPDDTVFTLELRVPPGAQVVGPWERLPGGGERFRYSAAQFDGGSYVAVGKLKPLGEVQVKGGSLRLTALDRPRKVSDAALRTWVQHCAAAVADFYGTLPGGRVNVILIPTPGSADAGVFGTVRRRGLPSVVLLFGADAPDRAFAMDWMGLHELFHLGNPPLAKRLAWVTEGLATYYQDVLLARRGAEPVQKMWGDLYDGFRRFCSGRHSLADESRRPGFNLNYRRVYWGSACAFFQIDVAIRRKNDNRRSLDDVVRALRNAPHDLSDDEVRAELARETSPKLVGQLLDQVGRPPLEEIYRRLGIEPTGSDTVKLHDEAPEAALRRGIF